MTSQFDLIENPSPATRRKYPHLVVLQSHHLSSSKLSVVAPVLRGDEAAVTLTSVPFEFGGYGFVLLVGELTTVDAHRLGRAAGSLGDHEDAIRRAIERVFTGF